MNIFILDRKQSKCAQYHVDKHVIKMILETAQLLCSAHWLTGSEAPYRLTHQNHPCSKWVRSSIENYRWLVQLGLELCQEYTYRYEKEHKTEEKMKWLLNNEPELPQCKRTEFIQVVPEQYKANDPVKAYRTYYQKEKQNLASWTKRPVPKWFTIK
ncbi:MAG: pyrimidine dimer DNA glycosylase/endonuclease V [Bacillota bacterium]